MQRILLLKVNSDDVTTDQDVETLGLCGIFLSGRAGKPEF